MEEIEDRMFSFLLRMAKNAIRHNYHVSALMTRTAQLLLMNIKPWLRVQNKEDDGTLPIGRYWDEAAEELADLGYLDLLVDVDNTWASLTEEGMKAADAEMALEVLSYQPWWSGLYDG